MFLEVFGCLWRFLEVFGGLWMYLEVFGSHLKFLEVFGGNHNHVHSIVYIPKYIMCVLPLMEMQKS